MITTCPDCGRDFHLRLSDPEKEPDREPNTQPCFPCWKNRNPRMDRAEAVSIMASLLRLLKEYESVPSRTFQGETELICPLCFKVEFLVKRLDNDCEIYASKISTNRGQPQVHIARQDEAFKLKQLLASTIVDACAYKLRFVCETPKTGRGRRISASLKQAILLEGREQPLNVVAKKHSVWKLWRKSA